MPGRKILVCVAWPYANGPLHMGHMAGSIMPADIFARYHRMVGDEVLMVSGSDMHGAPISVRAEKEHSTPERIASKFHEMDKASLAEVGASFDLYTSTHTDNHVKVVQEIFLKLLQDGHLERRTAPQFYCQKCQRYLPDRYVEGVCPFCGHDKARGDQCDKCGKALNADELTGAKCQICSSSPILRPTEHFFFKLTAFEGKLKEYVSKMGHWRSRTKIFTENLLGEGLQDRAITRDLAWGIPVPVEGFDDKCIYVWFEAVIGYLSASKEWAHMMGKPDAWKDYWTDPECRSYYFLGKDNIIFHTIIWPAIIMGYGGINLPYDIPANEFMNLEGQKFSKSAGISIDLPDMLKRFQPDAIRYYLSINMPETRDTEFDWEDFVAKVNNELVAAYGNLIHRTLSFTQKNFGLIPPVDSAPKDIRDQVAQQIESTKKTYVESLESCNFKLGIKAVMDLARFGNQFFDSAEPWALLRKDRERCGAMLNLSIQIIRALAVMAYPYLPFSSEQAWRQVGDGGTAEKNGWKTLGSALPAGKALEVSIPTFKKIDLKLQGDNGSGLSRLDLRIGRVLEVSDHPKADKLYLLSVDVGRRMTIVSGLKDHYTPDQLIGKDIVVVCNLEPAVLRGVKSEGMLLAAESKELVSLLVPMRGLPAGTPVNSGLPRNEKTLSFAEFQKLQIVVGEVAGASADIGGAVPCSNASEGLEGRKLAFFIDDGKATILRGEDGTAITIDREVSIGAKVK